MAARAEAQPQPYRADWKRGSVASWLTTVDHKRIGILYVVTSLFFFFLGGLLSLFMRAQLATPNEHFVTRDRYNELFTIHGTTMVFLVVVPILAGFGNYMVPLMIGARDMAFPRLNAFSYWMFLLGGIVLYSSFFAHGGPAKSGWTAYPPLSEHPYSGGNGQDLWILSLHLLAVSSLAGAINFIATIHNMRAPGMTWTRMPLFVWSIEVYAWLLVVILPVIGAGLLMLLLDRQVGTHFFLPSHGGSALLYQHIFWFFGHPEVYVLIIPAFGIISEIIPVFARKPIFGYKAVAFSSVGIAFVSMLVWAHHMFTVGLGWGLQSFFMIMTDAGRRPDRREDLQLAGDDLAREPDLRHADAVRARVHRDLHPRRPDRDLPGRLPGRLAGARHVLRRRALPLRDVRRVDVRDLRRVALLVAEDVRANAQRGPREGDVLADVHRVQRHLLPAAPARADGDAATGLHVRPRRPLGDLQPDLVDRLRRDGDRRADLLHQRLPVAKRARGRGTTPGSADTLEWFAPSPPPPENFPTRCRTSSSPRPLRDLRMRLKERNGYV